MSIATRLGDWSGQGHMWAIRPPRPVERAAASIAAAGAMQSCTILLRSVHPWGPARPYKRQSQVVTWLLCANAAGRRHERLGGTSGNPCATATAIAALCTRSASLADMHIRCLTYGMCWNAALVHGALRARDGVYTLQHSKPCNEPRNKRNTCNALL